MLMHIRFPLVDRLLRFSFIYTMNSDQNQPTVTVKCQLWNTFTRMFGAWSVKNSKVDRRVQRTQIVLQQALTELIAEKGYYAVTVQDITERANIGRTTFYAHYNSKEELFLSAHFASVGALLPEEIEVSDLLAEEPPEALIRQFEVLPQARPLYFDLAQGGNVPTFQRAVRSYLAQKLEKSLRKAFSEETSALPFALLANYLASSQLGFVTWWIECRSPYNAREIAQAYQRMQRAVLRDALGLT